MLAVRGTTPADVATIRVYCDGGEIGTATPDGAHNWRLTLPSLPAGSHDIAVTAADAADNVTPLSAVLSLNVDAEPPPPPRH